MNFSLLQYSFCTHVEERGENPGEIPTSYTHLMEFKTSQQMVTLTQEIYIHASTDPWDTINNQGTVNKEEVAAEESWLN